MLRTVIVSSFSIKISRNSLPSVTPYGAPVLQVLIDCLFTSQAVGEADKKIAELLDKPQRIHDVDDVTLALDVAGPTGSDGVGVGKAATAAVTAAGGTEAVAVTRALLGMGRRILWRLRDGEARKQDGG